ncbi:Nuclear receptor coactivator 1 [Lonchura striata]|uniref:Nuclear receptor coactivator 1 n=3 Tax=Lonchura striata TaxID=40157 RepID=A0A218UD90_9PASE|nr:Nuclear receptor coactivator 1 [Lonchura striata domestica]
MYNNMSITVSMAGPGGSGGGSGVPGVPGVPGGVPINPVMAGIGSVCSEQVPDPALGAPGLFCPQLGPGELLKAEPEGAQVQQVQVFADVQCTVNVVGDAFLPPAPPAAKIPNSQIPNPAPARSLLQQLLTE